MAQKLAQYPDLQQADADKDSVKASEMMQKELRANDDVTVYRERRPDDRVQWWGHGDENRNSGNSAHKYADLVATGNGSGDAAAGDQIEGDVIIAITDSDHRILAERKVGDVDDLADAADDRRTERPMMPAYAPYLEQGRYREVIINADEESDGDELDPDASSARLYYSETSA